jgi:signal transduction histidine kinase
MALLGMARGRIMVRTGLSDPGTVCCLIEDSGPGIDPTHLPHLFDSFYSTKEVGAQAVSDFGRARLIL